MKGMKTQGSVLGRRITNLMISLGILLHGVAASAHPMLQPRENRTGSRSGLLLEPRIGIFSTSSNFLEDGSVGDLPGGVRNTRTMFDLNASLGLTDNVFVFGRASLLSVSVQSPGGTPNSQFGLADQLLGAAWRAFAADSGWGFNLQAEARIPAYSNDRARASGKPYLGDGSLDGTIGGYLEVPDRFTGISDGYLELGAAYTRRNADFSSALPLSVLWRRDPAYGGWVFDAGMRGQISLKTDAAGSNPTKKSETDADRLVGSSGSMLINGINPSWFGTHLRIGHRGGSGHTFTLSGDLPLFGASIPSGILISLGATFDFNPHAGKDPSSTPSGAKTSRKANPPIRGFLSYDLEAKVLSTQDSLYLVKIDRGANDSVEKGQLFDIFKGKDLLVRAKVTQVRDEEAILTVLDYQQDQWIESGMIARRLLKTQERP